MTTYRDYINPFRPFYRRMEAAEAIRAVRFSAGLLCIMYAFSAYLLINRYNNLVRVEHISASSYHLHLLFLSTCSLFAAFLGVMASRELLSRIVTSIVLIWVVVEIIYKALLHRLGIMTGFYLFPLYYAIAGARAAFWSGGHLRPDRASALT